MISILVLGPLFLIAALYSLIPPGFSIPLSLIPFGLSLIYYLVHISTRLVIEGDKVRWTSLIGRLEVRTSEIDGWIESAGTALSLPRVRVENRIMMIPIHSISKYGDLRSELSDLFGQGQLTFPYALTQSKPPGRSVLMDIVLGFITIRTILALSLKGLGASSDHVWTYLVAAIVCLVYGLAYFIFKCVWPKHEVIFDKEGYSVSSGRVRVDSLVKYAQIESALIERGWNDSEPCSLHLGFKDQSGQWRTVDVPESSINFEALYDYIKAQVPPKAIRR